MSECDSSNRPVSVVGVGVSFFTFSISPLKPMYRFASNFLRMFLEWTHTKFVKSRGATPFFHGIMGNFVHFWPFYKKSTIKPLTRNHSYLV